MLELLRAAALNHRSHRLERAILSLRKPTQIPAGHRRIVAPAGVEEMPVAVEERRERRANGFDDRSG